MTSGPPGEPRQVRLPGLPSPGAAGAMLVGVTLLGLLVVVLATASGPVDVLGAPPPVTATGTPTPTTGSASANAPPPTFSLLGSDAIQPLDFPTWLVSLLQALAVLTVVLVGVLVGRSVWRVVPRIRSRAALRSEFSTLPELPQAEVVAGAAARLDLLRGDSPRNAIVAAWQDLEDATAAAGVPRDPSETSTEYTVRVLRTWDVGPGSMGRFAALYREARFSEHRLTEADRAEAIRLLTDVHTDIELALATAAAEAAEAAEAAAAEEATSTGTPR